jgi:hypothetical protein
VSEAASPAAAAPPEPASAPPAPPAPAWPDPLPAAIAPEPVPSPAPAPTLPSPDGPVIEAPRAVAAAPAAAPVPRQEPQPDQKKRGPMEIDLTSVLGEIEGVFTPPGGSAPQAQPGPSSPAGAPAPPASGDTGLDDVFKDFRDAVTRQGGVDQSAQHMKLARTYLEMGMLEEAITALKNAVRSPRQRFEAGVLLGRLYKSRGDVPHAIEWFERAAEAPAPTADEGRALLYNLAATLEEAGEIARALAVFLELQADAGDYRDVAARVDHLSRVQTGG